MIGIFDSGSGGLTVLKALREKLPNADIAYFGDIRNAPYGEKAPAELAHLTKDGISALQRMGAGEFISACNTASASVLAGLVGHDRVIEMTRPLARTLRKHAGKRALLLATPATVASRIYNDALDVIVSLDSLACPGLAGDIEHGVPIRNIEERLEQLLEHVQGPFEVIILGCTHYPLIQEIIATHVTSRWPGSVCIDPAESVASAAAERFSEKGSGMLRIKISKDSNAFRARVEELFPHARVTIEVA